MREIICLNKIRKSKWRQSLNFKTSFQPSEDKLGIWFLRKATKVFLCAFGSVHIFHFQYIIGIFTVLWQFSEIGSNYNNAIPRLRDCWIYNLTIFASQNCWKKSPYYKCKKRNKYFFETSFWNLDLYIFILQKKSFNNSILKVVDM